MAIWPQNTQTKRLMVNGVVCWFWLVRAFFKGRWAFFGARLVPVGGEIEKGGLRFCFFVQGVAEPWSFGG